MCLCAEVVLWGHKSAFSRIVGTRLHHRVGNLSPYRELFILKAGLIQSAVRSVGGGGVLIRCECEHLAQLSDRLMWRSVGAVVQRSQSLDSDLRCSWCGVWIFSWSLRGLLCRCRGSAHCDVCQVIDPKVLWKKTSSGFKCNHSTNMLRISS